MALPYSRETQAILNDFLQTLAKGNKIDPDFLAELRRLTSRGELGNQGCIKQSIARLKVKADELQDKQHKGP